MALDIVPVATGDKDRRVRREFHRQTILPDSQDIRELTHVIHPPIHRVRRINGMGLDPSMQPSYIMSLSVWEARRNVPKIYNLR